MPSDTISRRTFGMLAVGTAMAVAVKPLLPTASAQGPLRPPTSDLRELHRRFAEIRQRGGGELRLDPGRVYDIGDVASPQPVFLLRDLSNVLINGQGAKIVMRSRGLGQNQLFLIQGCTDLTIANLSAQDYGARLDLDWQGVNFFYVECSYGASRDVLIDNCALRSGVSFLTCAGINEPARTRNIVVQNSRAADVYYGVSFQENGDHCKIGLEIMNCRRAYFVYGVRDHQADLRISSDLDGPGATACILIKRYTRDTSGIMLRASFAGNLPWTSLAGLEIAADDNAAARIENVQLVLDTRAHTRRSARAQPLTIRAYRGTMPEPVSRGIWSSIRLAGWFPYAADEPVHYLTVPLHGADIAVDMA